MKKIAVITLVYNEAETVREIYNEIEKVFANLKIMIISVSSWIIAAPMIRFYFKRYRSAG